MKVLVLGKNGMLGHMVYEYFDEKTEFETVAYTKENLNALNDYDTLHTLFQNAKPDYVINCIGLIHQHAEEDLQKTFIINSAFPHILSNIGIDLGFKLIHISSDCAFDNTVYGKSKLAGEVDNHHHLTIRTSIIGPEINPNGTGLFHWFMQSSGEVNGFTEVFWDGVTTLELAEEIYKSIIEDRRGLLDFRSIKPITKHDLLYVIKNVFDHSIIIKPYRTEFDLSRLNSTPDLYCVKDYSTQINRLYVWVSNHKRLYNKIYASVFNKK